MKREQWSQWKMNNENGKRIVQKGNKHLPPCVNMIPCVNHKVLLELLG
jgi:hypothetical protein